MTRRILLLAGLALLAFDVAHLTITGIALAGAALMVIAGIKYGMLTRGFWVVDEPEVER